MSDELYDRRRARLNGLNRKQKPRIGSARRLPLVATTLILGAALTSTAMTVPGAATPAASASPLANEARSVNVTDTAHLTRVRGGGEYIIEEGTATGMLPGRVRVVLEVGPIVVAKFTIYASAGSISGSASGKLKGRSEEPSIGGTMTISRGTGRYRHAHGHGGFYGAINLNPRGPRSYKMIVQTTGTLSY
jgi:hypothetical protein